MSTNQHTANRRQYRLSLTQRKAIDLLLSGKNDREVAEQLGVGRSTVARWRLQDPKFQLALDRRRAEVWPTANDFIPSLLPTALASMSEQLRVGPNRGRLALDFVFRAGLLGKPYSGAIATAGIGPTSMTDLLDREVLRHRSATTPPAAGGAGDDDQTNLALLPITQVDRDAAHQRLLDRLHNPDPDESDDSEDPDTAPPEAPVSSVAAPTNGHSPTVSASTKTMSSFR